MKTFFTTAVIFTIRTEDVKYSSCSREDHKQEREDPVTSGPRRTINR